MPSLHQRLRSRNSRILTQLGAIAAGIAATVLIANDEPVARAVGTAIIAVAVVVTIKLALVAINAPRPAAPASRPAAPSVPPATQQAVGALRADLDELTVRVAALEALDRRAEAAIADMAATQFELKHVREELDRLRSEGD